MSASTASVEIHIVDGQLLTNRPDVFAKNFEIPETAPVDGLTRVSQQTKEERWTPTESDDWPEMTAEDWKKALDDAN